MIKAFIIFVFSTSYLCSNELLRFSLRVNKKPSTSGTSKFIETCSIRADKNEIRFFSEKKLSTGEIIRSKKYSVIIKNKEVKLNIQKKKNLHIFRQNFHKYILEKKYNLQKVKILSSLIFLNIAPLHQYPYNEFLFYYGKYNLTKILQNK